jgi:hypothetical protein
MDSYSISERDINAPPATKIVRQESTEDTTPQDGIISPPFNAIPSPGTINEAKLLRNNSSQSSVSESDMKIDADYAHYTDAPPPFAESQYEGKTEERQSEMRLSDYAKEMNRFMGKQLVKGLKTTDPNTPL